MRAAFSDFLRERGRTLRMAPRGIPRDWQPGYLAALERTGDPEESCRRAGAVLETVQAEIERNATLREKCTLAIAKCVARIEERNARKAGRLQEAA